MAIVVDARQDYIEFAALMLHAIADELTKARDVHPLGPEVATAKATACRRVAEELERGTLAE